MKKSEEETALKTVAIAIEHYRQIHRVGDETFSDALGRAIKLYNRLPEIQSLVNGAFKGLLNSCTGNTARTLQIKAQRKRFMALLRGEIG